MIILIISIVLFILLGVLPQVLNCFEWDDHYYTYDEKGTQKECGRDIDKWPNGKPDDYDGWRSYPVNVSKKYKYRGYDWDESILAWVGTVPTLIFVAVTTIIAIDHHTPWEIQSETAKITEHIVRLETNRDNLLSYYNNSIAKDIDISSTNLPGRVNDHNAEVEEFVVKLKQEKISLNNPWINVFYNPAYKNVDITRVEATYISLQ